MFTHSKLIKRRIPLSVAKTRRLEGGWAQRGEAVIYCGGADIGPRIASPPGRGAADRANIPVRGREREARLHAHKNTRDVERVISVGQEMVVYKSESICGKKCIKMKEGSLTSAFTIRGETTWSVSVYVCVCPECPHQ